MVEPVTWIGDRKTPLASLFALVSLIAYVSWTRDPREGQRPRFSAAMFVCVGAYVVSLLAKPTTIMLPIAFALLDFWPLRRLSVRSVLEKAPLFAVMFVSAVVTYVSQKNTSAVILPRHGEDVPMLLGLCYRVVFYLHKFLLPVRLTSLYPIPKPLSLANGQILASLLAAVALAAATLLSLRRTRAFAVGGLIFFVLLAPTLGTIQFTHMIVADKYMYFPVIGLLITLTWLVVQATSRVAFAKKASIPLLIGIVALEAAGTRGYLAIWRDGERFDKHKAAMAPDSALAQYDMGVTFVNLHRPAEAIASYRRALELDPNNASAHNNLGNVLAGEGQLDEALGHLTRAVQLDPAVPDARMNLANLLAMKGQYDQAFAHYESLLQNPRAKDCGNRRNYAFALFKAGLFDRAIVQFNKVIELGCGNARVHCRLGAAFAAIGRRDEALQHLQKAVQLDPQWPEPAELAARLTASAPGNP